MKTELARASPEVHHVLAVTFPGGTKRYSDGGVGSATLGQYDGKVLSWGQLSRVATDRGNALTSMQLEVEIDDTDTVFAGLLEGATEVQGAAASVRLASPNVAEASWFTLFSGLLDSYTSPSLYRWRFILRPDDRALERSFPRVRVTQGDWPYADPSARGQIAPLLYGKFANPNGGGALPCLPVDLNGARYLVCYGRAKSVDAVYKDGVQQTSGYSVSYPLVGGRRYTVVGFTASLPADVSVTCDAQGYEPVGNGSGALIENPADQLLHVLVNFVYGDAKDLWLSSAGLPIDTNYFTGLASFFTDKGHKGSHRYSDELQKAVAAVNEWCQSWQVRAFWTNEGRLAVAVEDHRPTAIYQDEPWLRDDRHEFSFRLDFDAEQVIDRIHTEYLMDETTGSYTQSLEVRDPSIVKEAPETLSLPWSYGAP